jgi:ATP adenylyltransferase/5',5'''-P-1,P-4-tetraphosphate phosphorylase II
LKAVEHTPTHLLLGDFNALRAADYTDVAWKGLCQFAEKAGWEPRQEGCYQLLATREYR